MARLFLLIQFPVGGFSSTESSFTTGFLTTSGTITFTAKVTDSRGRVSDAKTVSISVEAYAAPSFTDYSSQRAISDGTANDDGTYIRSIILICIQLAKIRIL